MSDVPVIAPDGTPGYVPKAGVRDIVDAGGRVLDASEAKKTQEHIDLEEKYSGLDSTAGALAAGAARGATLGGSDVALSRFGGEGMRRRLLDYQDVKPGASILGEVAGIAVPALFGDEAGVANLPGLVGKLGARAEAGVAGGLGGGMLARGAGMAARGAGEGAIYAAGKAAGDAALHNEELTTEKALAAVGHGAMFGAGANVLLGGAGAGLSRLLSHESGEAGAIASRVEGGAQRESTGLGDMLQEQRDRHVFKALGGTKGDVMAAERNVAGGYRKVADDVFNVVEAKGGRMVAQSKRSINEIVSAERQESGERIGSMFKKLDAAGDQAPDIHTFLTEARSELVAPHQTTLPDGRVVARPAQAEAVHEVEKFLKQVEDAYSHKPPTFAQWHEDRMFLDKQINFAKVNQTPAETALTKLRGIMEEHLDTSAEAAAKNMGGSFSDAYQAEKSLYQSMRIAQALSDRGVAGQVNNNSFGLGAMFGGAAGLATGGPLGGIAMGLAGKLVKDRGDMMAADLLHRAANIAGVARLAARTDATMSSGIASLLGSKAPVAATAASTIRIPAAPMGVALSGNLRGDYKKVTAEVVKAASNPVQTTDRVAKALGPEATKSPKIAAAMTQIMLGDITYLHAQMPPPRLDAFSLQPHLQKDSRASESEMSKWMQQAEVLANPTMVLDEAKKGTLSRVHVEALKERRPEMYQAIRTEVLEQVTTTTKEIPYATRIQLGILLDIPTDRTLAPDFQQAIQATYSSAEQAGEESPPPLTRPLAIASAQATPLVGAMTEGLEK